jgi:membrane protein required for colicin V production
MVIDVAFLIVMSIAIFKGFTKGFVVGVFSFIAFIIGLAAALKLSAITAHLLQDSTGVTTKWLPVLSFALVFIVVVFIVNFGAKVIKQTIRFATLGWLDKIAGIIIYVIIYTIIFSVILFFAEKTTLIKQETIKASSVYNFVAPWGLAVINHLGKIIPLFKDLFIQLQSFFQNLGDKLSS